jgi:hypothetical protein
MKNRRFSRDACVRPLARAFAFARIGSTGLLLLAPSARAETDTCRLFADTTVISLSAGQVQNLRLSAPAHPFNPARVFGSFAGTTPGMEEVGMFLPHVHLPLNRDRYFVISYVGISPLLQNPPSITGPYAGFVPLDVNGRATTVVSVPPALHSVFVGRTVYHAFATLSVAPPLGYDCASNPIALTFAP